MGAAISYPVAQSGAGPGGSTAGTQKVAPSDSFFLIQAARSGDTEVFSLFLKKNPALAWAVSQPDRTTPWHSAAAEGHLAVLQDLASVTKQAAMSNTFNPVAKAVNQADAQGVTPLMQACTGGHVACVDLLITLGADVLAVDQRGNTALHYGALAPHSGCLQLLLRKAGLWGDNGPQPSPSPALNQWVNAGDIPYGRTPLHLACWSGQVDGAVALLSAGASFLARTSTDCYDGNLPCNSGTTPLHLAAMRGHQEVTVAVLAAYVKAVKRGVKCDDPRSLRDAYGNTPHRIAATRRHDAPVLQQVLNPATVIKDIARWERRHADPDPKQDPQKPPPTTPGGPAGTRPLAAAKHAEGTRQGAAELGPSPVKSNGDGAERPDGDDEGSGSGTDSGDDSSESEASDPSSGRSSSGGGAATGRQPSAISIRNMRRMVALYGSARAALSGRGAQGSLSPIAPPQAQMEGRPQVAPAAPTGPTHTAAVQSPGAGRGAPAVPTPAPPKALPPKPSQPPPSTQHMQLSMDPAPDFALCPLTCRLFNDPVVAADGYSYERTAIEQHLKSGSQISPSTKKRLSSTALYPNHTLKSAVEHWKLTHQNINLGDVG